MLEHFDGRTQAERITCIQPPFLLGDIMGWTADKFCMAWRTTVKGHRCVVSFLLSTVYPNSLFDCLRHGCEQK